MTKCIEWDGRKNERGYGQVHGFKNGKATTFRAHRLAYENAKGPIPDGMCVMHICDNRGCVNPDHLVLGTHQENMADRQRKNRHAKGSRMGCSKLIEGDIPRIRDMINLGVSNRQIASWFAVDHKRISDIRLSRAWVHA